MKNICYLFSFRWCVIRILLFSHLMLFVMCVQCAFFNGIFIYRKISFCKYNEILLALHFILGRQRNTKSDIAKPVLVNFSPSQNSTKYLKKNTYKFVGRCIKVYTLVVFLRFQFFILYFFSCQCNCPFLTLHSCYKMTQEKWQQTNKYLILFARHSSVAMSAAAMLNSITVFLKTVLFYDEQWALMLHKYFVRMNQKKSNAINSVSHWVKQITVFVSFFDVFPLLNYETCPLKMVNSIVFLSENIIFFVVSCMSFFFNLCVKIHSNC